MTAIISFGFVQRFQQRKVSCLNPSQLTLRCCCSVRRGKLGCFPRFLGPSYNSPLQQVYLEPSWVQYPTNEAFYSLWDSLFYPSFAADISKLQSRPVCYVFLAHCQESLLPYRHFLGKTIVIWCPKGVQCPRSSLPLGAAHRRSKLRERPRRANERRPVGLFFFLLFFRHAVGIHTMRKRAYYIYIYHYISLYIIIYHYISLCIIIYHYISLYIIIYHYISLYIIIYHYISHMLCHVMSCHVMSCHVMSCDVKSCDVMWCDVMCVYIYIHMSRDHHTPPAKWFPPPPCGLGRGVPNNNSPTWAVFVQL